MGTLGIYSFPRSGSNWLRKIVHEMLRLAGGAGDFDVRVDAPDIHTESYNDRRIFRINDEDWSLYKSHGKSPVYAIKGEDINTDIYIYILRHPLDVFLSHLNYAYIEKSGFQDRMYIDIDTVQNLKRSRNLKYFFSSFMLHGTIDPTFVEAGSWFESAENWTDLSNKHDNVFLIRYEDLCRNPLVALSTLKRCLPWSSDDIVTSSLFAANASSPKDGKFNWQQRPGYFEKMLPKEMQSEFFSVHGERAMRHGYGPTIVI
ncbi:sulfotransferase domain-containing protein [Nitrospirillum sp. BR 11752]|uniref:sulfotransferase domain-containing protein n=1 Tax=Nitrospirillum sp. BR 11752 TaxID=3104293 RepID=UPI002EC8F468|nr:sulfotransferase domain-containing protein [Nitrospirillum sp. BR 11752]